MVSLSYNSSLLSAYSSGVVAADLLIAALFGLPAMIVFFTRRHFIVGALCPAICALFGLISPVAELICGIVLLVIAFIVVYVERQEEKQSKSKKQKKYAQRHGKAQPVRSDSNKKAASKPSKTIKAPKSPTASGVSKNKAASKAKKAGKPSKKTK